jgi:hypothetical protein
MTTDAAERDVIVAAFADPFEAKESIDELRGAGFSEQEIGVIAPQGLDLDREEVAEHSMVAEASVIGAMAGAGLGSLWGMAMAAGLLPLIGPVVAGGLLASLVVTAATGAALGGLAGALAGLGVPEDEAVLYEQKLREGQVLLTVRHHGRAPEALAILERNNASVEAA